MLLRTTTLKNLQRELIRCAPRFGRTVNMRCVGRGPPPGRTAAGMPSSAQNEGLRGFLSLSMGPVPRVCAHRPCAEPPTGLGEGGAMQPSPSRERVSPSGPKLKKALRLLLGRRQWHRLTSGELSAYWLRASQCVGDSCCSLAGEGLLGGGGQARQEVMRTGQWRKAQRCPVSERRKTSLSRCRLGSAPSFATPWAFL